MQAVPVGQGVAYGSSFEVKAESSSDVHSDSSMSETWVSTSKQPGIADYVVSSSGFVAGNSGAASGPAKKLSNRPSGPRKAKPEVAVSGFSLKPLT